MALHEFVWECLEFHMHIIESVMSAQLADENMKYLYVDKYSNILCNCKPVHQHCFLRYGAVFVTFYKSMFQ